MDSGLYNGGGTDNNTLPPPGEGTDNRRPASGGDTPQPSNSSNNEQNQTNNGLNVEESEELARLREELDNTDNNEAYLNPDAYQARLDRINELENMQNTSGSPNPQMTQEALEQIGPDEQLFRNMNETIPPPEPETAGSLFAQDAQRLKEGAVNKVHGAIDVGKNAWNAISTEDGRRKLGVRAYKTIKGFAPIAGKKVLKGAAAVGLGAVAGVAGAALTDDPEKAIAMGLAGGGAGISLGGKVVKDNTTFREAAGAAKYGSVQDYRNAMADKAYLKSNAHKEEYEKYFKTGANQMSKQAYDKAVREYRQVGITDTKKIRDALKLEQKYKNDSSRNHGSEQDIRGKVQNIVQTYENVDKKAVYGDKNATQAALKNIEGQLSNISDARQKRAVANEILQGYRDWYNI